MMNTTRCSVTCGLALQLIWGLMVCSLASHQAFAQDAKKPKLTGRPAVEDKPGLEPTGEKPSEPSVFRVYQLRYANAVSAAEVLRGVFGSLDERKIHLGFDERTNRLLVFAGEQDLERVRHVIEALDREAPAQERQIKVFQLQNITPDALLMETLSMLGGKETRVSMDPQRDTVVATGTPEDLLAIESVLMRLDSEDAAAGKAADSEERGSELLVRLVWLVEGMVGEKLHAPSADLDKVLGELRKIGVGDLSMPAQLLVNTAQEHVFSTTGSATLGEAYSLELLGAISESGEIRLLPGRGNAYAQQSRAVTTQVDKAQKHPKLQLMISVTRADNSQLCQLQTTIRAPIGQSVVLGVSPIGERTSVFVVQVLPRPTDE